MTSVPITPVSGTRDSDIAVAPSSPEDRQLFDATPISRLGNDVLGHIFMLNTYLDLQYLHIPSQTTRRTSQVCRRWREFALNYPMLWASCIDFADPLVWIKETATRSGSAPIPYFIFPSVTPRFTPDRLAYLHDISSEHPLQYVTRLLRNPLARTRTDTSKTELAMSLLQRPQRILIKINKAVWVHVTANVIHSSPNLEYFSLNIQDSHEGDEHKLPQDLFAGVAPKLTTLILQGCSCHFHRPIFHNLTTLVVLTPPAQTLPSAKVWLAILKEMKKLRRLELTRCFKDSVTPDGRNPMPMDVCLPQLESLLLVGDISSCSALFTRIQFPPSCTMHIQSHHVRMGNDFISMLSSMQNKFACSKDDKEHTYIFVRSNSTMLAVSQNYSDPTKMHNHTFSFDWFADHPGHLIDIVFPSVVTALKVYTSEILALQLSFGRSELLNSARVRELLSAFGKAEELTILMGEALFWFLAAVKVPLGVPPLLPSLRSIELQHVLSGQNPPSGGEDLVNFVRGHSGIRNITFNNCTPAIKSIAAKLEELGVIVADIPKPTANQAIPDR